MYHIRKGKDWIWPYTVIRGSSSVITICMTLPGAKRAIERDKAKRAKPLKPLDPIVWQED